MTGTNPEKLWEAIAAAPVRAIGADEPDPILDTVLTSADRYGIVRLTTYNGSQIFVDFDNSRYYRAPKTTNYMMFDWTWNHAGIISDIGVGAPVLFSNLGGDWYRTSLVRHIDRLTSTKEIA